MSPRGTFAQSKEAASSAGDTGSGRSVSPAQKARRPVSSAGVNRSRRAPMSRSCSRLDSRRPSGASSRGTW
ncbi:Uncharacterised protein [Flavonifractor plautii]|uniref:Uncharacterized protein n=1 Tax=Flavonifractor plautii TaxID=292800 RepID=A0A174VGM3_FLAPL|nr:Uncharacterised protein [Flavonifractor plautii]